MSAARKRNVLLAIAAAVVLAGVVVAIVAASGRGGNRSPGSTGTRAHAPSATATPNELTLAAQYLGVPKAKLRAQLRSGSTLAEIADATHGKSATGLVRALVEPRAATGKTLSPAVRRRRLAILRRRIKRQVDRVPGYVDLAASARYLGISVSKLRAELRAGHSLAEIADTTAGKSASGLIEARVSAREATLKTALASDKISKSTAAALLASLRRRVTREVRRTATG
jgi:hypothetical protein